jgi:manganese/zinc/iron transport system substrate-binding protein
MKVFCTTGQVADAIRHLVGDDVEVVGIMGPGVDPHLYQALPSDILALKQADIVFYNGLHLEGRMIETLESFANRKPVVAVAEVLKERGDKRLRQPSDFDGYYDPHVWHDVRLWADCVSYAADRLAAFDAANAEDYMDPCDGSTATDSKNLTTIAAGKSSRLPAGAEASGHHARRVWLL